MSSIPLKTWNQVENRVRHRIASRSLRHARFYKLQGAEAKTAVIEECVARLLKPDAVFPYELRRRLKPRQRQLVGNLSLPWWPVDPLVYAAWLVVHRSYIERGSFWFEKNEAADNLIDLAVDVERDLYCSATADCGDIDPELLERFSEAGQMYARTPEREREQQKREDDFDAARDARAQIEAEENAKLIQAINADLWMRKRPEEQRQALNLILFEPSLKGKDIAGRCQVLASTVSKIRKNVEVLADQILTIPEECARSVTDEEVRAYYDANRGSIQQPYEGVAEKIREYLSFLAPDTALDAAIETLDVEPGALYDVEVDKKGNAAALKGDPQDWAQGLTHDYHAPDTEVDVSENIMRGYARMQRAASVHCAPRRRQYSDSALMRGSERHRATSEDQAFFEHKQRLKELNDRPITDAAAATIQALAEKFGLDAQALLKSAALRMSLDEALCETITGPKRGDQ